MLPKIRSKVKNRIILLMFLFGIYAMPSFAYDVSNYKIMQKQILNTLSQDADNLVVDLDHVTGAPKFILIEKLNLNWNSEDPVERSYQFLNKYKGIFGTETVPASGRPLPDSCDTAASVSDCT